MKKPKAVLFDLDDTIIDRRLSLEKYSLQLAADFAYALTSLHTEQLNARIVQQDAQGYKPRDQFINDLMRAIPWSAPVTYDELRSHWFQHYPMSSVVAEGAREVMKQLAAEHLMLGIVTNGATVVQHTKIDRLGIRPMMKTVIVSEEAGLRKPDPGIFAAALREMNVQPEEVWFVGDHPVNDMIGAREAGLTPVWLRGKHPWPEDVTEPSIQIDRWQELLILLRGEG
ncbi:HAD family hydrolase [Paenibacillus tarimensis]|uniref:HAD family hydrolase n=1 Tax=Paenibacillus tarimensis TaxID=416012 RepID=UPI001F24A9A1|nr:HAD family hydrolase [Paenibacillus tarimensis]MCF2945225.1 HAD family hydrolase [Paenibacillus tarimensis]